MAGSPPAEAAHPSGINGIIVTVPMNEATEPKTPKFLIFISESKNKSAPNNHSETPKPTGPDTKNRVHPKNKRAVADVRISVFASYSNHF
jgi:hypothetical protein